jgi:hypothetical protein
MDISTALNNQYPVLRSADLYECAYYFSYGCTVKDVELVPDNRRELCILHMTGERILELQQSYFKSDAVVNLFDFRRSYNRLMNVVALARKDGRVKK